MTFPFEPPDRYDEQVRMYHVIGFREDERDNYWNPDYDPSVHQAFWDNWYNDEPDLPREVLWELLREFLAEYGLDYEDLWDWDDFRAWYDATAA